MKTSRKMVLHIYFMAVVGHVVGLALGVVTAVLSSLSGTTKPRAGVIPQQKPIPTGTDCARTGCT